MLKTFHFHKIEKVTIGKSNDGSFADYSGPEFRDIIVHNSRGEQFIISLFSEDKTPIKIEVA
jgi:hypothetical protein